MVAILYGIGSIMITYIENQSNPEMPVNYVPSLISIGISLLFIGNPGDVFNKLVRTFAEKVFSDKKVEEEQGSALELLKTNTV